MMNILNGGAHATNTVDTQGVHDYACRRTFLQGRPALVR